MPKVIRECPSRMNILWKTGTTLLRYAMARQAVAGTSTRGVSALSVISLRRNGISMGNFIGNSQITSRFRSLA